MSRFVLFLADALAARDAPGDLDRAVALPHRAEAEAAGMKPHNRALDAVAGTDPDLGAELRVSSESASPPAPPASTHPPPHGRTWTVSED